MSIKDFFTKKIRALMRIRFNKNLRRNLINNNFSLISANCTGGVISHELGLRFLSPTVNLFMSASDFVKFSSDLKHYTSCEFEYAGKFGGGGYPLINLDDILLHCVHYATFEEFSDKWTERCKRINWDNLFFIMAERDGCTEEDIKAFDTLPYKNKAIFVHKPMPEYKSAVYLPGTELDGTEGQWVCPLTSYKGRFTGRRYIDDFDYVSFFNSDFKDLMYNQRELRR